MVHANPGVMPVASRERMMRSCCWRAVRARCPHAGGARRGQTTRPAAWARAADSSRRWTRTSRREGRDRVLRGRFQPGHRRRGRVRALGRRLLPPGGGFALRDRSQPGEKYATTQASNADVHLSRTLLQLEGLYRWPNGFFMGAGLMHHMSPTIHRRWFFRGHRVRRCLGTERGARLGAG